ncbi:hypothetical protein GCM10011348_02330 [Marinobacterium nitratireducens]|uniref:FimV N-terminal domain-containing protein n=1 Tax=Marinobacterium nitratireducens TaxID=518897 RepID=A0A917Z603_9GAMM|nr:FimV/HubP family polar landmark protein [Marinobacterium nitratireducens]GGO76047.1 hypothetical protein GCM10011348_02330 [Marinobacterium nitratireducens]
MFRKLAVSLAVAGVLSATQASALGLGQIRIKSALNEPLDAEIQLLRVRDLDAQQIQPQMADMDQFAIAGIDRSRLVSSVQFSVDVRPNGTGVIHMTSSQPVREPFLNLLVEVNWPSGRLVREYTVLLDPPVFEAAPVAGAAAPVQAPVSVAPTRPAPTPVRTVAPAPSRSSAPVDNIRTRAASNQVFVETQDTLGALARRHSPGGGTTLNQMMLALQRKNPQAFPNGNINFLKAGMVLDLPTLEEVRALSPADANREVSRQMQAWKTGNRSAAAPSTPQTDGSKKKPVAPSDSQAEATPASQPQLKILTPEDTGSEEVAEETAGAEQAAPSVAASTPEAKALLERNEALENQLAVTQETVDRVERENAELNEKLTAITQQLETLQRLLELKDQQMAALQTQLQQVQETPQQPAAAPAPPNQPPSGLVDTLTGNPAYMAGIGAVIGALLVALLGLLRRRKDSEARPYNVETAEAPAPAAGIATGAAAVAAGAVAAEALSDEQPAEEAAGEKAVTAQSGQPAQADELDLDMDLDLDLPLDEAAAAEKQATDDEFDLSLDGAFEEESLPDDRVSDIAEVDDEEFDLSFDTELEGDDEPMPNADAEDEVDDTLDEILGDAMGDEEEAERADLRSGMGQLESLADADDEPEDTLESLGLDSVIAASDVPKQPEEEAIDFSGKGQVDALDRSDEEAEEYRLSMVQPVVADDDEDLLGGGAVSSQETAPDEPAAQDETSEVDESPAEPAFEFDDTESAAPQQDETLAEAPESPAFEFDEDFESAGESPARAVEPEAETEVSEDDIDAILAQAGAELTLEDEPEATAEQEAAQESVAAETADDDGLSLHPDLEELLSSHEAGQDEDALTLEDDASGDDEDLDEMLAALEKGFPGDSGDELSEVEEELTTNIAHDLEDDDSDLDSELEALLGSVDDEIALDESGADDEDLGMEGLEFLDGTDEVETKLDLARAYIDMEDRDGAKDILSEILSEGSDKQQQEARKLMESLS